MQRIVHIVRAQPRPVKFLVSRFLMRSGLCRMLAVQQEGFSLNFYPSSHTASLWISPGDWHGDKSFFWRYLQQGDVVIDIGANIGLLTAVAAVVVGQRGRVYAIEAHPRIFRYLRGNIERNKFANVTLFEYALGDTVGSARLSDERADDFNRVVMKGSGIVVSLERLDNLPIAEGEIALVKIDVEGFEKFVIVGGERTLTRTKCMYVEVSEAHFAKFGYTTSDLVHLLHRYGFRCFRLLDSNDLVEVDSHYAPNATENIIALRDAGNFQARTGIAVPSTAPAN